ncbi:MAG: FHA domain-containing protein [Anaerolineae bacterium]|jgi:hypothetical protein|nr:FHA domain-containing protein [Anaerolineae bacterium]MBT7189331.1 FHA domain-containing protein [Anaerolineae bacterium]MBT7989398.1 FHA domain-containing protein [Anaerolineae bacterium]
MAINKQQTLFALDCGATNWRLYRSAYEWTGNRAKLLGEPQASPITSFIDRKLPSIIYLDPEGANLESFGELAQQELENKKNRGRVREYFKPCIGSHLEENPLPHQRRYTHAQAMQYTRLLLSTILEQIRQEKWRAEAFDDRLWFTFAYPIHWRYEHGGKIFAEHQQLVQECFGDTFKQIRFVAEPEGAILSLQHRGLLEKQKNNDVTLIVDVGGSTTDIIAGQLDPINGKLNYLGRYGEPFGGGLYDAELAKYIADELNIPASALADDPSALVSLRVSGQRLKESLSRQMMFPGRNISTHQRNITLVMRDGTIFRRLVALDEVRFRNATSHLDNDLRKLIEKALTKIAVSEEDIAQVVLVGGGAQLFTIMSFLRERFGTEKVLLADNPDEVVVQGIGLEYQASFDDIEPTIIFPAPTSKKMPTKTAVSLPSPNWFLQHGTKEFPIQPGTTTLGRGKSNHIQVEDIKASRLHAEITLNDNKLEITDKGSTNGTFLNGQRLKPYEANPVKIGDMISIGKIKLKVEKIKNG